LALEKVSDSDVEDGSFDGNSDAEVFSPLSSPTRIPFPGTQAALTVGHHRDGSEDEEVIIISGKKTNLYLKM
jgi:hypothetical protein